MLADVEAQIDIEIENGVDSEDLIDLYQEKEELRERINFAWQDQEYDSMYAADSYDPDWAF